MVLDKRSWTILFKILEADQPLLVKNLSHRLSISERTVWYNLNKINDWLISKKMKPLERIRSKGISINQDQKKNVRKLLKIMDTYTYIYSSDERKKIMALRLLDNHNPLIIKTFQEGFIVSKNTILKELKELKVWYSKRGIQLISKPGVGYYLEGDEGKKRDIIKELMIQALGKDITIDGTKEILKEEICINGEFKRFFKNIDTDYLKDCIRFAEKSLEKEFAYHSYVNLVMDLGIAVMRIEKNHKINISSEKLQQFRGFPEYEIAKVMARKMEKKFNIKIPEDEISYIVIHLISTKIQKDLSNQFYEDPIMKLACTMVEEFEKIYGIVIEDKKTLIHNLTLHLRPAIHRLKFEMNIDNPLLKDIKKEYKKVYEVTTKVIEILENKYDVKSSEEEIAYIAMHFGSAVHSEQHFLNKQVHVLLVCSSGIGTSKLLEAQLTVKFPQIHVMDMVSSLDYDRYLMLKVDFIISTINLESKGIPIIVVNPLLNEDDCKRIQSTFSVLYVNNKDQTENVVSRIMNSIGNHCSVRNYKQLQNEITFILKNLQNTRLDEGGKPMLTELITPENIQLNVEAVDWEDAIYKGAKLLLDKGNIEERYIEGIIRKVKEIGPYIVIAPGIALPHARPEDGVNHLSMSLITLKNPVCFGNRDNDPVKLVIILAAVDNETHLKALSQLMGVLCEGDDVARISKTTNKKEVLDIIKKHSQ